MRRIGACVLAIALWAPIGAAQEKSLYQQMMEDKRGSDLVQYHRMLEAYGRGDEVTSVEAVLQWTHERIMNALADADGLKDPFAPWDRRRYGLAAMLHTDAALRLSPICDTGSSNWHLKLASTLLAVGASKRPNEVSPLAERWYLTMSRYFRDRMAPYVAELLLALGRERLPANPVVLYESGTLAELFATDYALIGMVTDSTLHGANVRLQDVLARRTGYLNQATGWLRGSVALDSSNNLAKVHLGRVLALARDDQASVATLERVLAGSDDATIAYLAHLFIGGVRERQGDLEAAAAAYRAAIARQPTGHAACIGLSEALQRMGKVNEARAIVQPLVREESGPTREPLWWYQFEPPSAADARLDGLRKDVRQ